MPYRDPDTGRFITREHWIEIQADERGAGDEDISDWDDFEDFDEWNEEDMYGEE